MFRQQRPKYNNTKVEYDGELFDSKRELDRYLVLLQAQKDGLITDLERQPHFILAPAIKERYVVRLKTKCKFCERTVQQPVTYTADFRYKKGEETIVEDVKISPKILPKEFTIKIKMLRYLQGIVVRLIYKSTDTI